MHENKHPSFVNEVILYADRFGELAFLLFIRYSKAQFPPKEKFPWRSKWSNFIGWIESLHGKFSARGKWLQFSFSNLEYKHNLIKKVSPGKTWAWVVCTTSWHFPGIRKKQKQLRCFARFGTICNLKNVKNTHGRVLLLVNLTKSNTPPWVFFTFFRLYRWCQITQSISITHPLRMLQGILTRQC